MATNLFGVGRHWVRVSSPRPTGRQAATPNHATALASAPAWAKEGKELQKRCRCHHGLVRLSGHQPAGLSPTSLLHRGKVAGSISDLGSASGVGGLNTPWDHTTSCNGAAVPTSARWEPSRARPGGITPKVFMIHTIPAAPRGPSDVLQAGKLRSWASPATSPAQHTGPAVRGGGWHGRTTARHPQPEDSASHRVKLSPRSWLRKEYLTPKLA